MSELYERIEMLCKEKGVTVGKMCNTLGISRGNLTELKKDRIKTLKSDNLTKISNYFSVTIDYLLGNVSEPYFYLDNERILREINSYEDGPETENAPVPKDKRAVSDDDIKAAFFEGAEDLTPDEIDALWNDAKEYVQYKIGQIRKKND